MMRGVSGSTWTAAEAIPGESLLTQILRARGITAEAEENFLRPTIRDALPDPDVLLGMRAAAGHLARCVLEGRNIGIYSDYDADGATSAGVLGRWIRTMNGRLAALVVPDRMEHGYGPNAGLITGMFEGGCDAVFILDSGTVASATLNPLPKEMRENIFVIDHHMPAGPVPDIGAVVNPNLKEQAPGYGHLAAVGVTFLLCLGAQRELVRSGHLPKSSMQDLAELLDYVAIGTVCDVVPLVGVNRAFVYHGLRRVKRVETNPIGALLKVAGKDLSKPVTHTDCGFVIGPRLNAEGRIGRSDAAARFLLMTDPAEIRAEAETINRTNTERKAQGEAVTATALEDAKTRIGGHAVVAVTQGHPGIVGISASRVKDETGLPSVVLTEIAPGVLQGSARSVDGFNIGEAIHHAVDKGLLIKGGGHAMAGGVTIREENLDAFREHLDAAARESDFGRNGITSNFDLVIPADAVSLAMVKSLSALAPCGRENPDPSFVLRDAKLGREAYVMSGKHLKIGVFTEDGRKKILDAIIWGGVGTPVGEWLRSHAGQTVTLAGEIAINVYNDKESLQMIVSDIRADAEPEVSPRRG